MRYAVAAAWLFLPVVGSAAMAQGQEERIKELEQGLDELEREIQSLKGQGDAAREGTTGFLLTGYSFATYTDVERSDAEFSAGLNPIFLWELTDRILFEGELEIELEDDKTEVALEYAQVTVVVNDYLIIGAGKFLLPFSIFAERLHPAWINKLPDAPKPFLHHGGFAPMVDVGIQFRGGVPLGEDLKINYAVFVTNGPQLMTMGDDAGELDWGIASDNNSGKAVGGRIGVLPFPWIEIGVSQVAGKAGDAGDPGFENVDAHLLAADVSVVRSVEGLGTLDFRAEYVRSEVDPADYSADPDAMLIPGERNLRKGFYVQAALRPDKMESFLKDAEIVVRYDKVDVPDSLVADESRVTVGVTYWLTPSTAVKAAYRIDDHDDPTREANAFLFELAVGF